MKRKTFIKSMLVLSAAPGMLTAKTNTMAKQNSIRLLRHATLVIQINTIKLLIDPMLSSKDALDPVQNCGNDTRFPMVELPVTNGALNTILSETDAIVVTHLHRDHWDMAAQHLISKDKTIFCQPNDHEKITVQGFTNVIAVPSALDWKGITISRTTGQHGTGEIGKKMGEVSGFVFTHKKESVYLAGDTIWCDDVAHALAEHQPKHIILNTGGAKF